MKAVVSIALEIIFMKKLLWRALFILIPFLYSIYASAQPENKRKGSPCFSTEEVSIQHSETCIPKD